MRKKNIFLLGLIIKLFIFLSTSSLFAQNLPVVKKDVTRVWIGSEYMTNPLMNWRLNNGRIENTHGGWVNEVHSLTHQLKTGDGHIKMSVRLGPLDLREESEEIAFAGFKVGAMGHRNHYLSNVLHDLQNGFARKLMKEPPIAIGITSDGKLRIGAAFTDSKMALSDGDDLWLEAEINHVENEAKILLTVKDSKKKIASLETIVERSHLYGNVALASHGLHPPPNKNRENKEIDHPRFWFADWQASGDKFVVNKDQTLGPILWSQYTLHEKTLKMMAFFVPIGETENQQAALQTKSVSGWKTVAENQIEPLSRSVLFRVDNWEDAGWSFTLPSVSTNTHRAWRPEEEGKNRRAEMPAYTGQFLDGWGNKITMWAATNPGEFATEDDYEGDGKLTLKYLRDSAQGYGIVRFNKRDGTVTFESWPVYGNFEINSKRKQHTGFPKTISMNQ